MVKTKSTTIAEYINTFPEEVQNKLQEMRRTISKAIPDAREEIKWSQPAFVDERILVMFGGFKNHTGFYTTPGSLEVFEDELSEFKTGKGSIQFPYDTPLPNELIIKITQYRDWESKEKGVTWK